MIVIKNQKHVFYSNEKLFLWLSTFPTYPWIIKIKTAMEGFLCTLKDVTNMKVAEKKKRKTIVDKSEANTSTKKGKTTK